MEKRTIRSGAPFVLAGAGVMAVALTMGIGSLVSYPVALAVGAAGYWIRLPTPTTRLPTRRFPARSRISRRPAA